MSKSIYKTFSSYKSNILKDKSSKKLIFQSDGRSHYVYRITYLITGKHYYGSRVIKSEPKDDLGIKYFSSSSVKEFLTEQKEHPENFKYKIIKIFDNPGDAILYESYLHQYFQVSSNINFINKSKQTPFGFSLTNNKNIIKLIYTSRMKLDENGLTSYDKVGLKISKSLNCIQPSGKTKAVEIGQSGKITRNKIQSNGLTINENNNIKQSITKNIIQENGLTNAQNGAIKAANTMNQIKDNGLSIYQEKGLKYRNENHNLFCGYYIINDEKFATLREANNKYSLLSAPSIKKYCKNNNKVITKQAYYASKYLKSIGIPEIIIGKTFKMVGFSFILPFC